MSIFGESTLAIFLANAFAMFLLVLWLWLFVVAAADLFRRTDMSAFGKVLWTALLIALPYIGIFTYILTQGGGMAERHEAQAMQAREGLRMMVEFSVADELMKLDRLKSQNVISEEEHLTLRGRLTA